MAMRVNLPGRTRIETKLDDNVRKALVVYALLHYQIDKSFAPTLQELFNYCHELYQKNNIVFSEKAFREIVDGYVQDGLFIRFTAKEILTGKPETRYEINMHHWPLQVFEENEEEPQEAK